MWSSAIHLQFDHTKRRHTFQSQVLKQKVFCISVLIGQEFFVMWPSLMKQQIGITLLIILHKYSFKWNQVLIMKLSNFSTL